LTQPKSEPESAPAGTHDDLEMTSAARDVVLARADGALVVANVESERGRAGAQHLTQGARMASATLGRAGLGRRRRGMIETESDTTFVVSDGTESLCMTVEGHTEIGPGLAQIGRLWTKLGAKG